MNCLYFCNKPLKLSSGLQLYNMVSYNTEALKDVCSTQENIDGYNDLKSQLENTQKEISNLKTELQDSKIELAKYREAECTAATISNYTLTTETEIECECSDCLYSGYGFSHNTTMLYTNGCFQRHHMEVYDSTGKKMERHQIISREWKNNLALEISYYYNFPFSKIRSFIRKSFPKETCPESQIEYDRFVDMCWNYANTNP